MKKIVADREKHLLEQIEVEDVDGSDSEDEEKGLDGTDDGGDDSDGEFSTSMDIDSAIAGHLISFEIGEMVNLSSPQLLGIFVDTEEEMEKLSGGSALKKTQKSQRNQPPKERGMLEWQDF